MPGDTRNATLKIFDFNGRLVGSHTLSAENNDIIISRNELQRGIYVYELFIDGELKITKRMLVVE